ncbi:MAG: hypothetical protein WCZ86_14380, partial [Desulfurivibrionaceae bacterium]
MLKQWYLSSFTSNVTEEISAGHGKAIPLSPVFHKTFFPECKNSLIFTLSLYGIFRYLTTDSSNNIRHKRGRNRNMGSHSRPHNDT